MAYGLDFITRNAVHVTTKLQEHGIPCTLWNPDACTASGEVELQLGFETEQDEIAARSILGLVTA